MTKQELLNSFTELAKTAIAKRGIKVSATDIGYLAQHLLICYSVGYREERITQELNRLLNFAEQEQS